MIKVSFSLILVLLFFSGCIGLSTPNSEHSNKKAFEKEDVYILLALRSEQLKDYNSSSYLFNLLYENSSKKEYLYRSLQSDLSLQNNEKVVDRIDDILDDSLEDFSLVRIKIIALIQLQEYEKAKQLALNLVELSGIVDDYILVSDIYVKLKKFDTAVKYLESAYTIDYSEKILDKIAIILYINLQREKDAIAQLETHSRMHGCSKLICSRLLGFYSNDNNVDGLLSTSLRLYEIYPSDDTIKRIIQIYSYKKDYVKLAEFLENSKYDDELLLQLYSSSRDYKKALSLADKLYTRSGNIAYLAQSAIFEYEISKDKSNKSMQKRVIDKLEKVLKVQETPLYLNYLGYLIIDHEIDVKLGMDYVKKALKIEPNSAFYLDSLAWGYYKLGSCKKAYKIMKKVLSSDDGDDPDVLLHKKAIMKCIKQKKVNKK